jgi:hypothetical protein
VKEHIILMADIIGSSGHDQAGLMKDFKEVVQEINHSAKEAFLSPLTITLGDEFQGVLKDLPEAIRVVQLLEETLVRTGKDFRLRYVIVEGLIETPINPEIAYGMLGDGLTRARKYLEGLKNAGSRFFFWLKDQPKKNALNNVFTAIQEITGDWDPERDYYLVTAFLAYKDYKKVAMALNKEPSLMWKRRKSLKIDVYLALKEVAAYIGGN